MTAQPADWWASALCAQVDGDLFFPEKGNDTTRKAKAVCAQCPVITQCRQDSLANDPGPGIRGGLTERERRRLTGRVKRCQDCADPITGRHISATRCLPCQRVRDRRNDATATSVRSGIPAVDVHPWQRRARPRLGHAVEGAGGNA